MSCILLKKIDVCDLNLGINFIKTDNDIKEAILSNSLIIYKINDDNFKCYYNLCKHQGGKFLKNKVTDETKILGDIEDLNSIVKCTRHGWKLDCSKGEYMHCNKIKQKLLNYTIEDKILYIYDEKEINPWQINEKSKLKINEGEYVITFFSHACVEIKCGNDIIFTDPWFEGPAFGRGWWNLYKLPDDAYERLSNASYIYISHFHSDHLSYHTLKKLYDINPDVSIIMGNLNKPIWRGGIGGNVQDLKFKNLQIIELGKWFNISKDTRIMILPDGIYDDLDTCLLVEYKGHKIMDFVDCCMPNNRILPQDIEVILSDFAGGSSGYPSIYHEMYGEEETLKIAKEK